MAEGATARAWAPGKVILLGEHFVVHGVPAMASAIDRGIEVVAARVPGKGVTILAGGAETGRSTAMIETILVELGISLDRQVDIESDVGAGFKPARSDPPEVVARSEATKQSPEPMSSFPRRRESSDRAVGLALEIHVRSEIPTSAGLGASAAFCVASIRALVKLFDLESPDDDALFQTALAAETHAHRTPSGIDPYASVYGGIILYETGPPRRAEALTPSDPLDLVIAVTSEKRDTGKMVARAAAFAERDADGFRSLLDSARKLSAAGKKAIEAGDLKALGGIMNDNHCLLQALGVSTPGLDALVEAARAAGAAGAKLTGAGGGGAMIALCPGRQNEIGAACERAGAVKVIPARIG